MARGRFLSTSIALDAEFNAMTINAQLLFLRTIPHLDKDGLIIGQPTALWAMIAPLLPELLPQMADAIEEWIQADFVEVIDTKIGPVLYFTGFHDNQIGLRYEREPATRYPLPAGYRGTENGLQKPAGNLPADSRQTSGKLARADKGEAESEGEDATTAQPDRARRGAMRAESQTPLQERKCLQKPAGNLPASCQPNTGSFPLEVEVEVEVEVEGEVEAEGQAPAAPAAGGAAAAPPPPLDPVFAAFVQAYEHCWALPLSGMDQERIAEWSVKIPLTAWQYALQETKDGAGVGRWKYLLTVLKRVEQEGWPAAQARPARAELRAFNAQASRPDALEQGEAALRARIAAFDPWHLAGEYQVSEEEIRGFH